MKKFTFSLEKVLSFKQQTLDVKKNELALLQMKLIEFEKEIDALNNQFAATNRKMVEELQKGLNAGDILIYKTYFNTLNQKILRLIDQRKQLLDMIVLKKADIVAVNSEISGLEKLRDKQLTEYLKQIQKSQELAMDEYVGQARGTAF
ncbi:flagellar export protein FliJ [Caproiciproducens faecalis]|uniref:Flagellar FliJ protein n=1 Tax=Caproiciproducens faecalis TaxID=2820301 RepID=A0ABS7DPW2_9FIRM|nr:flagellar FliJ family protein [Caproiciproducens faecalis]MBW7573352.1 flagellar FliJ family protein [Caproiciproducens faecalis]